MFKDVFKLKKNAWHARLMKYTWNLWPSDFTHMCPYFWLMIFTVIISPFTFLIKFVIRDCILGALDWVYMKYDNYMQEKIRKWEEAYLAELKANTTKWEDFVKIDLDDKKNKRYSRFFFNKAWEALPREEWHKINDKIRAENEKRDAAERKRRDEKIQRIFERKRIVKTQTQINKDRINSMLKIIKPIVKIFLYVFSIVGALFVVFLLYKLIHWLGTIPHKKWITFGEVLIGVAGAGLIFFLCGVLGNYVANRIQRAKPSIGLSYDEREKLKAIRVKRIKRICLIPAWPFIMLWKFIILVIQLMKDSCPAIQWED